MKELRFVGSTLESALELMPLRVKLGVLTLLALRLFAAALIFALLGHPALAAVPQGDITVIASGELTQAVGNAIAEAQTQLGQGAGVGELFRSPAFLTALLGLLGALPTFFGTNGLKLSTSWIRGNKTRVLAALLSMITAGLPAYFTVSQVAGVEGPGRIGAAVAAALGALLLAIGKHETDRTRQTGQRHPDRKGGAVESGVRLGVIGLKTLAQNLGVPGMAFVIDALITDHTVEQIEAIIKRAARERALTGVESDELLDAYEAANILSSAELAAARAKLAARRRKAQGETPPSPFTTPLPPASLDSAATR